MFSIVVPLYNKEKEIKRTLESIFAQTFGDYEIVIVDDGSTDSSLKVLENNFQDSRIRIIRQVNRGVAAARNKGISEAKYHYIALIDADDEWKPDYLQTQAKLIETYPDCSVFATDYEWQFHDGKKLNNIIRKLPFKTDEGEISNYFEIASLSNPPLWTSAVVAKKSAFEEIGGFPLGIKSGEDLLTWARLACRFKIAYNRTPLAIFNVEGYETKEKPKRMPAENDLVATGLMELMKEYNPPFIKDYISLWHKMRSSVYMRLGIRGKSIKEALKGLKFNPWNHKLYAFILINLLPRKFQPFGK